MSKPDRRAIHPVSKAMVVPIAVVLALVATAGLGSFQQRPDALISPTDGSVGQYVLGSPVSAYSRVVKESNCRVPGETPGERCYISLDGNFFLGVDSRGIVQAVRTTSPEMFTDRYVRPRFSRMEEVVSRYGVPERIDRAVGNVVFVYKGELYFQAEGASTAQDIMPKAVVAIALRFTPPRSIPRRTLPGKF